MIRMSIGQSTDICVQFDRGLLLFYSEAWTDFQFSIKVLNGVCSYLNRHWVTRERDERGDDSQEKVYAILDLGVIQWKDILYGKLYKQLINEILKGLYSIICCICKCNKNISG